MPGIGGPSWHMDNPPDYTDDLNFMHLAEMFFTDYGDRAIYVNHVYGVICRDKKADYISPTDHLMFATARQRA